MVVDEVVVLVVVTVVVVVVVEVVVEVVGRSRENTLFLPVRALGHRETTANAGE